MRIRADGTTSVSGWNDDDEYDTEVWTAAEQCTKRIAHRWEETARETDGLGNKTARERARQLERDQWERTLKDGDSPTRAAQRNGWWAGQVPQRKQVSGHTGGQVKRPRAVHPPNGVAASTADGSSIGEDRRVHRTSCLGHQ